MAFFLNQVLFLITMVTKKCLIIASKEVSGCFEHVSVRVSSHSHTLWTQDTAVFSGCAGFVATHENLADILFAVYWRSQLGE